MNYKEEAIKLLRKYPNAINFAYPTLISFTFEQLIEFILYRGKGRFCKENEIDIMKKNHQSYPKEHPRHNGQLKYQLVYYSPHCDDDYHIIAIQNKITEKLVYLYFDDVNDIEKYFGTHAIILFSKITLASENDIIFSWDNDNEIALGVEIGYRLGLLHRPEIFYKALYEILTYFQK